MRGMSTEFEDEMIDLRAEMIIAVMKKTSRPEKTQEWKSIITKLVRPSDSCCMRFGPGIVKLHTEYLSYP